MENVNVEETAKETDNASALAVPVQLSGLAFKLSQRINSLAKALVTAIELESGLGSKAAINKTSVALRDSLIFNSRGLHKLYADVLPIRSELLENVEEIAAVNKKDALIKKIAEQQALLDAM